MNADFGILGANGSFGFFCFFCLVTYYFGYSSGSGEGAKYDSTRAFNWIRKF